MLLPYEAIHSVIVFYNTSIHIENSSRTCNFCFQPSETFLKTQKRKEQSITFTKIFVISVLSSFLCHCPLVWRTFFRRYFWKQSVVLHLRMSFHFQRLSSEYRIVFFFQSIKMCHILLDSTFSDEKYAVIQIIVLL